MALGGGGVQLQVYANQAPAVEGDFASRNPRATVLAGPTAHVAGPTVLVARFAWLEYNSVDFDSAPAIVTTAGGAGPVAGFIHREQQGLIVTYLADASMQVQPGFPVTVHQAGDFWVKNRGTTQALPGMFAYANFADGSATFQASGAPAGAASGTASSVAAETSSFTGTITGNVLTASGTITGTIYPGTTISGTNVATGTVVTAQLTGTPGGDGTYSVSIPEQTVASTTITGTYGLLTVGGTVVAGFQVGSVITGTGITATTTITALVTGAGGAGTYVVNVNTVVASTTISASTQVQTKWFATNSALAGELVKMSSWALG